MKYFIPVAILLALTACGNEEQTVVLPEPSSSAQQSTTDTSKDAPATDSAAVSASSSSLGSSGSSGSSGASDASGSGTMYTVKEGDTLAGIANEHNIRYQDLARWNKIEDPDLIYPSQKLRLSAP